MSMNKARNHAARDPRVMPEPGDVVRRRDVGGRHVESVSACPSEGRLGQLVDRELVERWLAEHGWSRIGADELESTWWSRPGVKRWVSLSSHRSGPVFGGRLALNIEHLAASEGRSIPDILEEFAVVGCWVRWTRTTATKSSAGPQSGVCELRTWRRWARGAIVVRP